MKRISERDMIIIGINKTDPCCVYDSNSQMVLAIQEATADAQLSADRTEFEKLLKLLKESTKIIQAFADKSDIPEEDCLLMAQVNANNEAIRRAEGK